MIALRVAHYLSDGQGRTISAFQTPSQGIEVPAVVVWPGGRDTLIEGVPEDGPAVTWCNWKINSTLGLIAGTPDENAYDLLDEMVDMLPGALEHVAGDDRWNPLDVPPGVERVNAYQIINLGGVDFLAALVEVAGYRHQ